MWYIKRNDILHFNPNHDPKTGRFTKTLFVSGSSKTQSKDSPYYRKKLPKEIRGELKSAIKQKKNGVYDSDDEWASDFGLYVSNNKKWQRLKKKSEGF